jgi:hypothetical protein
LSNLIDLLQSLRDGDFIVEADEALTNLDRAVQDTGKKGTFTLSFVIHPAGVKVSVEDSIKVAAPKREVERTILFRAANGRFTRRDERQPTLPLRLARHGEEEAGNG